jgi:mannose-1-phosphate guanylyltransferase/mannose-6-phosphate isomerase
MRLVPVILCGGSGSRLWPLSRSLHPKQLLRLLGDRSLLQDTLVRLSAVPGASSPLVVCNEAQRFMIANQLSELGHTAEMILEPEGRNTAPAVAVAAHRALQRAGSDVLLLVSPADHVIQSVPAFVDAISRARPAAESGELLTFGVVPTSPETGYGYIRTRPGPELVAAVDQFVEKPDAETALRYLRSGFYLWNSGIFLFSAEAYLRELEQHAPGIAQAALRAIETGSVAADSLTLGHDAFKACRSESIDYAVMEKTQHASVVPLAAGWSDIGSFSALLDVSERDAQGNAFSGDVVALDCQDSCVRAESRLVAVAGIENCVVIETSDAVLVTTRDHAQSVKQLVGLLEGAGRPEAKLGRKVFRPWGSYDSLDGAPGFQVKRLTVLPGAILSLQLHRHRAEHWVVVSGLARITCDSEVFELGVGAHTFIPRGARHRIENPGTSVLEIIEVQIGDYLGEDDIVRFDDRYGRQGRTD